MAKVAKKKAEPKKKAISIKNLDKDQRAFIEAKVKELKTLEAVKVFYRLEDAVSVFALKTAKRLKLPESEKV